MITRPPGDPVEGAASLFSPAWEKLAGDRFALSVVREGFHVILSWPLLNGAIWCRALPLAPRHQRHTADEVRSLLEKWAIEQVLDSPPVFSFHLAS